MLIVRLADEAPAPEDVKAGWTALIVFLLLIAALVVLSFSLVKQLRKAQAAKESGVYGDEPAEKSGDSSTGSTGSAPGSDDRAHPDA